jgi:hypothetical protein
MKATSLSSLTIGEVMAELTAGVSRVWANVAGEPLWFESSDAALRPAPEVAERIDRLRKISSIGVSDIYEEILRTGLPLSVAHAVENLIRRTRRSAVWRRIRQRATARLAERWRDPPLRADEDSKAPRMAMPLPIAMSRKQGQGLIPCAFP